MRTTKKNSTGSSGKRKIVEKVKALAAKKQTSSPTATQSLEDTKEASEKSMDAPEQKTEGKSFEGQIILDKLTFEQQMDILFNPLQAISDKYSVGKKQDVSTDPAAPHFPPKLGNK